MALRPVAAAAVLALLPCAAFAATLTRGPVLSRVSASEAIIAWETDGSQSGATVSYGTTASYGQTAQDSGSGENHSVHLTGLGAATTYHYLVDSQGSDNSFATAPSGPTSVPFSFIVYGDNRTNQSDHQTVVNAIKAEPGVSFLIQTGDMAQNYPGIGSFGQEWDQFFQVENDLLRNQPLFATIGNHETIDLLQHWKEFFSTSGANYYSVDWGQVHLAVLDAFEGSLSGVEGKDNITDAQMMWLSADLDVAQAAHQLLFISIHHGAFSNATGSGAHGPSVIAQQKVLPIALSHGVIAMFAGHDHIYERGCNGNMDYFVVGGGGAPLYDVNGAGLGVLAAAKSLSYVRINVQGNSVTGIARDPSGTQLDTFSLPTARPSEACSLPDLDGGSIDAGPFDAGSIDAGSIDADAGALGDAGHPGQDGGNPANNPDAGGGTATTPSGCTSAGAITLWMLLPLAALALRRRARLS